MATRSTVQTTVARERDLEPGGCSKEHRLRLLQAVPFFQSLGAEELGDVNARFRAYDYEAGEPIFASGSAAEKFFIVAHGKVKLFRRTPTGQDVVFGLLRAGEMFGSLPELGGRAYPDDAEAHTRCCVLGIGSADFQTILDRYPSVTRAVLAVVAERLQEARGTISQLSALPVEARIASALLKLGEKLGVERDGELILDTPLSRQDLAAMTGTTTESASRVMSDFRRRGLIRSGRRWIALTDRAGLAQLISDHTGDS